MYLQQQGPIVTAEALARWVRGCQKEARVNRKGTAYVQNCHVPPVRSTSYAALRTRSCHHPSTPQHSCCRREVSVDGVVGGVVGGGAPLVKVLHAASEGRKQTTIEYLRQQNCAAVLVGNVGYCEMLAGSRFEVHVVSFSKKWAACVAPVCVGCPVLGRCLCPVLPCTCKHSHAPLPLRSSLRTLSQAPPPRTSTCWTASGRRGTEVRKCVLPLLCKTFLLPVCVMTQGTKQVWVRSAGHNDGQGAGREKLLRAGRAAAVLGSPALLTGTPVPTDVPVLLMTPALPVQPWWWRPLPCTPTWPTAPSTGCEWRAGCVEAGVRGFGDNGSRMRVYLGRSSFGVSGSRAGGRRRGVW